jgi:hypothetical protein
MSRFKLSFWHMLSAGCFAVLQAGSALGQTAPPTLDQETVVGRREVDQMPLENFRAASRAFAAGHNLAPDANLRFVVIPRDPELPMARVKLKIDDPQQHPGDRASTSDMAIELADDGSFTLPDDTRAPAGTVVRSNQPAGSLHWRPLVVTPGEPANTRRLGDLRLECQAKEAGQLNRPDLPFFARIFGGSSISECASDDEHFFLAPASLASVVLDDGKRQLEIAPDRLAESSTGRLMPRTYHLFEDGWRERSYSPPLGDASWSNDTLLRFHYSASAFKTGTP